MQIRLQKILSDAGVASRRKSEELILDGKVKVNDQIVTELGFKADPDKDIIKVNNRKIRSDNKKIYIAFNKPIGIVSSRKDEKDRTTVVDCIPIKDYIYPVGRLDIESTGLILLTNDGDVTNKLLHPKYQVEKTYIATIEGTISEETLEKFRKGVRLEDGMTSPAKAKLLKSYGDGRDSRVEVSIGEGRNRQIRRMFDALGCNVIRLKRIRIGNIELKDLDLGKYRDLRKDEIAWLKSIVNQKQDLKKK